MITQQIIKRGTPKPDKKVIHYREMTRPGESKDQAFERVKKLNNVSDDDLKNGAVIIQIYDTEKMYSASKTYKRSDLNENKS